MSEASEVTHTLIQAAKFPWVTDLAVRNRLADAPLKGPPKSWRLRNPKRRLTRSETDAELTETTDTLWEERDRLLREREQAQEGARRLREKREAVRGKGFWQRLFRDYSAFHNN